MTSHKSFFYLFLTVLLLSLSNSLTAQSLESGFARAKINSNYDDFYVLVGDSLKNAQAIKSGEFFDLESGKQKVWVIPQYSEPYFWDYEFQTDSIYVLEVKFRSILREQSNIYSKLQNQRVGSETISSNHKLMQFITSSINMYTKEDYEKHQNSLEDYRETYLKIISNVDSLFVNTRRNRNFTKKIANGDSVALKPGLKSIYISHPNSEQKVYRKHFPDSTTTIIKHNFKLQSPSVQTLSYNIATEPVYNANLIIVSDSDSKIIVNDLFAGTGAAKLNQKTGPLDITIINEYTGEHTYYTQVINSDFENTVILDTYTKPKKSNSHILALFPGGSQIYKNQKVKGYALSGSFLVSGVLSFLSNQSYQSELKDFRSLQNKYNLTTNATLALEYGNKLEEQRKVIADKDNKRITLFTITGLIYALNLYDGLFTQPKGGYRKNTNLDLILNNEVIDNRSYSTLSLRYDF